MSLPGLPPLPKSLVAQVQTHAVSTSEHQRGLSPKQRQPATLDTQLAILRREMVRKLIAPTKNLPFIIF